MVDILFQVFLLWGNGIQQGRGSTGTGWIPLQAQWVMGPPWLHLRLSSTLCPGSDPLPGKSTCPAVAKKRKKNEVGQHWGWRGVCVWEFSFRLLACCDFSVKWFHGKVLYFFYFLLFFIYYLGQHCGIYFFYSH